MTSLTWMEQNPNLLFRPGASRKLRHSLGLVATAASTELINKDENLAFVRALWNAKLEPIVKMVTSIRTMMGCCICIQSHAS